MLLLQLDRLPNGKIIFSNGIAYYYDGVIKQIVDSTNSLQYILYSKTLSLDSEITTTSGTIIKTLGFPKQFICGTLYANCSATFKLNNNAYMRNSNVTFDILFNNSDIIYLSLNSANSSSKSEDITYLTVTGRGNNTYTTISSETVANGVYPMSTYTLKPSATISWNIDSASNGFTMSTHRISINYVISGIALT